MKVVVFAGGVSQERKISLISGREVAKALIRSGFSVSLLDPALGKDGVFSIQHLENEDIEVSQMPKLRNYLEAIQLPAVQSADIVFIALHGRYGEDGFVQALLETAGVPYTGSTVAASAVAMDKVLSKRIFDGAGIATPQWLAVTADAAEDLDLIEDIRSVLGENLVVKPADEGSTIGTTIIHGGNLDEIAAAIRYAGQFSQKVLVEEYISGRELTVGILEDQPLPVVEIVPRNGFYDYEHKYQKGKTDYICPAKLDPEQSRFLQDVALQVHTVLGCEVFSRVDFRMDSEGRMYCLELNTIPGLTPLSLLPMAAKTAGISFEQLCIRIIESSIKRHSRSE